MAQLDRRLAEADAILIGVFARGCGVLLGQRLASNESAPSRSAAAVDPAETT